MRDHFLEVICGCGDRRVLPLGQMAKDPQLKMATLADVALRIKCHGCTTVAEPLVEREIWRGVSSASNSV